MRIHRCPLSAIRFQSAEGCELKAHKQIFYGEFDGRRRKRVLVKVIGE